MEFMLAIIVGLLMGAAGALLLQRRHTAKVQALLSRLEELEAAAGPPAGNTGGREEDHDLGEDSVVPMLTQLTADVLAGRTTHVRQLIEDGTAQGLPLADQAIVSIHARLGETLSPAELARQLNVSLRSLERGLSFSLECTPRELILAVKMREARRLLESGELNVTGVAYRLGFSSPSHFSRRFRAFYKVPPSEIARRAA